MGNEQSNGQSYRADYRQHAPAPQRNETKAEEAERLNRVAAYDEKMKKFQRKDPDQIKAENWAKYNAIGGPKPSGSGSGSNSNSASPVPSFHNPSIPPPPAHFNTTSAANRPPPTAVSAGYPAASANYQQPKRSVTGGAGYSGASAHPTPAAASAQQMPADPNRARAARAAAMEAKTAKIKTYSKGVKADQWETYKQLEALEQQKNAAVPHNLSPYNNTSSALPHTGDEKRLDNGAAMDEYGSSGGGGGGEDGDAFYEQMFHLIQKAQQMPTTSLQLLIRIISNLVRADPSDPNAAKYRRLKLDNDKIQHEVVSVDGALEVLFAVGFERREGEGDGMSGERLECVTEDMTTAMLALEKLNAVLDSRK